MRKLIPYKKQAVFAYKTAARSLVTLLTLLIIFFLAYLKGGPYGLPLEGIKTARNLGRLDSLISYLPILKVDSASFRADTLERIKGWGFPSTKNIHQEECCQNGAFFHLFLPWEKDLTLSADTLHNRFKIGIGILYRDAGSDLKNNTIENIYLSRFVLFNSRCDSVLLADHYYTAAEQKTTESDINNRKKEFGKIAFLDDADLKKKVLEEEQTWLSTVLDIHETWVQYKDSIPPPRDFSFPNVERLASFLKQHNPNSSEIDSPAGKIDMAKGLRILGPLIFVLLVITTWFFFQAEEYELLHWKQAGSIEKSFPLSSISSGLFFFFEKNGPKNRMESRHFLFRWSMALLVSLVELLLIVAFPVYMSLLLPCFVEELLPSQAWKLFYYVMAFINLIIAMTLFWRIERRKYWSDEGNDHHYEDMKTHRLFRRSAK